VDAAAGSLTTSLSVTHGTLAVASAGGAAVSGSGTGSVQLTGTVAQINTTLSASSNVVYRGALNYNGGDSLTVVSNDGGNTGTGGALSDTDIVAITVNPVNDAPVSNNGSASGNEDNTINGTLVATDIDSASLTYSRVTDAAHGSVTVNANGTFSYTPNLNYNGPDSFTFKANDGALDSNIATVNLSVAPVNDAPVLSGLTSTVAVTPAAPVVTLSPGALASDVDNTTLASATVHISAGTFVGDGDILGVSAGGLTGTGISAAYNAATETLTLSGVDTLAHYSQALDHVTFQTTSANPTNSGLNPTRSIDWQLNDGSAAHNLSDVATTTVTLPKGTIEDFNADGTSDVLLGQQSGHFIAEWLMNNGQIGSNQGVANIDADFGPLFLGPAKWRFQDTGDFNADGKADVLWRHDNDGQVVLWTMNGSQITNNQSVATIGNEWHNEGVGDFTGDGRADVLWHNDNGQVALWTMNGAQITGNQLVATVGANWHFQGLLDANGDGKSDVLLRDSGGQVVLWTMDGAQITNNQSVANLGLDWNIQGTGDFNGDGKSDVLVRNDSGQVVIWQMNGAQIVSNTSVATPGNDWHVADVGDYNADGRSDILWRNDSGQVSIWDMNGATITNNHSVGSLTPDWSILQHHYDVL